jgi:hypothetical protein
MLFFISYSGIILTSENLLNFLNLESKKGFWVLASVLIAGAFHIFLNFSSLKIPSKTTSAFKLVGRNIQNFHEKFISLSIFDKLIALLFFGSFIFIQSVQLGLFYSINPFDLTVDYPIKDINSFEIFPHLFNSLNLRWFRFHYILAFLINGIAIYGITKKLNFSKKTRLITSFICFFIPTFLYDTINLNPEIFTNAYLAVAIYFLVGLYEEFNLRNIYLLILTIIIGISNDLNFNNLLPALLIIFIFTLFKQRNFYFKFILHSVFALIIYYPILMNIEHRNTAFTEIFQLKNLAFLSSLVLPSFIILFLARQKDFLYLLLIGFLATNASSILFLIPISGLFIEVLEKRTSLTKAMMLIITLSIIFSAFFNLFI